MNQEQEHFTKLQKLVCVENKALPVHQYLATPTVHLFMGWRCLGVLLLATPCFRKYGL